MIGIDLGSRSVKIVEMENGQIIRKEIYDTIYFYRQYAKKQTGKLKLSFNELGFAEDKAIVATGYGKIAVQVDGAIHIPEIQAHVYGAIFQSNYQDFTLLDIGGQDTKVIKVEKGKITDFLTNDKCAASSGRYMENMAIMLGISLAELSLYAKEPVELNSTCAIFGESEIIAKLVEGDSIECLAAGVNFAVYKRFSSLLKKMLNERIIISGGGALNQALQEIIAKEIGKPVISLNEPQFNGAIGCCSYYSNTQLIVNSE